MDHTETSFVIYHISSTHRVGPTKYGHPHTAYFKTYKTRGAALRTCAKFNEYAREHETPWGGKPTHHADVYAVCTSEHHASRVRRMVTCTNLLSGKQYQEASDTPGYCSPSSEAYWSM